MNVKNVTVVCSAHTLEEAAQKETAQKDTTALLDPPMIPVGVRPKKF